MEGLGEIITINWEKCDRQVLKESCCRSALLPGNAGHSSSVFQNIFRYERKVAGHKQGWKGFPPATALPIACIIQELLGLWAGCAVSWGTWLAAVRS
uniref:Uncharacterized protein n=1 Tax=Pavo cristatus TaxID=9049 RepID=A0A8C9ERP6_PAVCR